MELPAKPDPDTGKPVPPHNPIEFRRVSEQPYNKRRVPHPSADGFGPPLQWYYGDLSETWRSAAIGGALVFFGFLLFNVIRGYSLVDLLTGPVVWVATALAAGVGALQAGIVKISAGSDWLMVGRKFVNTYDLVCVTAEKLRYDLRFTFTDGEGRQVKASYLKHLRENSALVDLVYNGMLHSIVDNGCEIDDQTQAEFRLDWVESIEERQSRQEPANTQSLKDDLFGDGDGSDER